MDMKKAEKSLVFVEHIEKHLNEEGIGDIDVVCKICGKTINEIWDIETKKEHHLFIQPGIYEESKIYIDKNGTPFYVKSGRD